MHHLQRAVPSPKSRKYVRYGRQTRRSKRNTRTEDHRSRRMARTGTLSLKGALEALGFGPCYHMVEVFTHPEDTAQWEAAARGEPIDWHQLLEGYQATVDWPGCAFYEELLHTYPDASVLLSVRDPISWYDSVDSTIYQMRRMTTHFSPAAVLFWVMGLFAPDRRPGLARHIQRQLRGQR